MEATLSLISSKGLRSLLKCFLKTSATLMNRLQTSSSSISIE